jgi:hypothetical protein
MESTSQFIIFSGNYRSRTAQNALALQHERWSKLPGLDPVCGSAMAAPSIRSSRRQNHHCIVLEWIKGIFESQVLLVIYILSEVVLKWQCVWCDWQIVNGGLVSSVVRAIPTSDGNARMPSGHSRRTTELGRVEWFCTMAQKCSVFVETKNKTKRQNLTEAFWWFRPWAIQQACDAVIFIL